MKPIPMARFSLITPIIRFLEKLGSPIEKVMSQVNIPVTAAEIPETQVPLMLLLQSIEQAADREGIQNLGVAINDTASILDTGMFGGLISQSYSLYDALKCTCEISHLAMSQSGDKIWLIEEVDKVWFCQSFPLYQMNDSYINHSIFYSLALQLSLVRLALGDHWQPEELQLPTAPCPEFEVAAQLWNIRTCYHKPFTAIPIPRQVLATQMGKTSTTMVLADKHGLPAWQATAPSSDFVGSLEQTLSTLLLEGYPSIELTAEVIGTSTRSLQRNLCKQGLSYSRLMDKVRYQKALAIMQDHDIPLIDVAYDLGYSDPANFSHAFKRWAGVSPRQFRKHSRNEMMSPM